MNRRNYLKSLLALTSLGIGSFSIFKWLGSTELQSPITFHDWSKKVLILTELAETIIPKTDTPGAKEAGVGKYIISVMSNCYDQQQQKKFLSGLSDLEDYAESEYGMTFIESDSSTRQAIVAHFSSSLIESSTLMLKIKNKFLGKSFFFTLRELTVEGYCMSYLGSTQGLSYDPVPGVYQPCIPLSSHPKSWATK
jgi:hypothetical protein